MCSAEVLKRHMLVIGIARSKIGLGAASMGRESLERITERHVHIQERTSKNELELALDGMIGSWFRWYWLGETARTRLQRGAGRAYDARIGYPVALGRNI